MCLSLDHHRVYRAQRSPGGRERPGAARGLPAGSARAPAGRRFGGAPKPRRGPGPTRERRGGSVRSRGCTRIPARLPGPFPRGNGAKGRLLPNNSDLHSRNNAGGEPRAAGREPESREAGSAAPPAREPTTYWRARVGGNATLGGEAIPRGKGTRPRGGRRTRGGEARMAELPSAARRPSSAAPARSRLGKRLAPQGRRLRRDESGFFPVRSPGLAAPSPRPGPRPGQARAGRRDSGPAPLARLPPPASSAHQSPGPAAIPPRRGSATQASPGAWARPPRPQSLRHRGSGPGLRRPSPRPRRRDTHPHVPAAVMAPAASPPGRWAWAPVKSPSRQGLAASLSRRGCPAWSCVRHGSRLRLLPCPPAALLPPPPPAPRNLRPLAFPPRLPALPASPAPATVGERLVGEGRNAPPSASGAGEPGNRRRHLPTSPSAGGARKPPARRGHCPGVPRPAPPEAPLAWRIST